LSKKDKKKRASSEAQPLTIDERFSVDGSPWIVQSEVALYFLGEKYGYIKQY